MNNQMTVLQQVDALEPTFNEMSCNVVTFKQECQFAKQALSKKGKNGKDGYLMTVAKNNPMSLRDSILNVATVGLSLCPTKQHAYLVPMRVGDVPTVCLQISYRGFVEIAQSSGAIEWVQAKIVYENDTYENRGSKLEPLHSFDAFGDRGKKKGAYCVAKTSSGDYLVEEMMLVDIFAIRERSESYKNEKARRYSPWVQFEDEMIKKTVVKRASKLWPKHDNGRIDAAVATVNSHEGIDFDKEREDEEVRRIESAENQQKKSEEARLEMEKCRSLLKDIDELSAVIVDGMAPEQRGSF